MLARAEPLILNGKDCATTLKIPLGTPPTTEQIFSGKLRGPMSRASQRKGCSINEI